MRWRSGVAEFHVLVFLALPAPQPVHDRRGGAPGGVAYKRGCGTAKRKERWWGGGGGRGRGGLGVAARARILLDLRLCEVLPRASLGVLVLRCCADYARHPARAR